MMAIRQRCTEALAALLQESLATLAVPMIRVPCRTFLDQPRTELRNLYPTDFNIDRNDAEFFTALDELR